MLVSDLEPLMCLFISFYVIFLQNHSCLPRLAHGVGTGGASVTHACRVGEIFGSDIFQRLH